MTIAARDGALLRYARAEDLPAIDHLTGEDLYDTVRHRPDLTWEERKCAQNRELFDSYPEQVWVLERAGDVFGYITLWLFPQQGYGHIRFAHVDTGLDDAHAAARRAYEAVGFDRQVPGVEYWQDLTRRNPGSTPG